MIRLSKIGGVMTRAEAPDTRKTNLETHGEELDRLFSLVIAPGDTAQYIHPSRAAGDRRGSVKGLGSSRRHKSYLGFRQLSQRHAARGEQIPI